MIFVGDEDGKITQLLERHPLLGLESDLTEGKRDLLRSFQERKAERDWRRTSMTGRYVLDMPRPSGYCFKR